MFVDLGLVQCDHFISGLISVELAFARVRLLMLKDEYNYIQPKNLRSRLLKVCQLKANYSAPRRAFLCRKLSSDALLGPCIFTLFFMVLKNQDTFKLEALFCSVLICGPSSK